MRRSHASNEKAHRHGGNMHCKNLKWRTSTKSTHNASYEMLSQPGLLSKPTADKESRAFQVAATLTARLLFARPGHVHKGEGSSKGWENIGPGCPGTPGRHERRLRLHTRLSGTCLKQPSGMGLESLSMACMPFQPPSASGLGTCRSPLPSADSFRFTAVSAAAGHSL